MRAGYSGTPLHRKLGVKPGHLVLLVGSPPEWEIPELPSGASVLRRPLERDPAPDSLAAPPEGLGLAGQGVRPERRRERATGSGNRLDDGRANVVVAFFHELATLCEATPALSRVIVVDGSLWLAWPRRAGGHMSDITDNGVRECVLPLGLVDVKVAALDESWSALKTVWRRELRPGRR
jgi:hypothetical protein